MLATPGGSEGSYRRARGPPSCSRSTRPPSKGNGIRRACLHGPESTPERSVQRSSENPVGDSQEPIVGDRARAQVARLDTLALDVMGGVRTYHWVWRQGEWWRLTLTARRTGPTRSCLTGSRTGKYVTTSGGASTVTTAARRVRSTCLTTSEDEDRLSAELARQNYLAGRMSRARVGVRSAPLRRSSLDLREELGDSGLVHTVSAGPPFAGVAPVDEAAVR